MLSRLGWVTRYITPKSIPCSGRIPSGRPLVLQQPMGGLSFRQQRNPSMGYVRFLSSKKQQNIVQMDMEKELMNLRRAVGAHYSQGRYAEALDVSIQLQMKIEETMGTQNAVYASALNNVGLMSKLMGDHERAIQSYTEALHIYQTVSGKSGRSYLVTLSNLGAAYRSFGDASKGVEKGDYYARASEALGDVYESTQSVLGSICVRVLW